MTMSLSVERPIVTESACFGSAPDLEGNSAWNIFVARLPTSGGLVTLGDSSVCGATCGDPTPDIWGRGWKLGGSGGAPVGYAGGRPPALPGYAGGPGGGGGPGCDRRAGGAAQFGWRPGGGGAGGAATGGPG